MHGLFHGHDWCVYFKRLNATGCCKAAWDDMEHYKPTYFVSCFIWTGSANFVFERVKKAPPGAGSRPLL
eukprot:1161101-Pelagomonas_calceolata.AAC.1